MWYTRPLPPPARSARTCSGDSVASGVVFPSPVPLTGSRPRYSTFCPGLCGKRWNADAEPVSIVASIIANETPPKLPGGSFEKSSSMAQDP